MEIDYYSKLPIFIFAKNTSSKFLFCNETFAMAAGADSPKQLIGKDDYSLCWKAQADVFRKGDITVVTGQGWQNVIEQQTQIDKKNNRTITRDILVNKYQLKDRNDNCIGVIGSYIDITGHTLVARPRGYDPVKGRFYLGPNFANDYLSKKEWAVLKLVLLGRTAKQIALALDISKRTAEGHLERIKYKLQCKTKGDIIITAVKLGLTMSLI